ncbi:UNVERIFIED_CONTAM: hypothetical protein K2H54_043502 [Gekko kuhli]
MSTVPLTQLKWRNYQEYFLGTIGDRTMNHLHYMNTTLFDPGHCYYLRRTYFFSINKFLTHDICIYNSQHGDICEYLNKKKMKSKKKIHWGLIATGHAAW